MCLLRVYCGLPFPCVFPKSKENKTVRKVYISFKSQNNWEKKNKESKTLTEINQIVLFLACSDCLEGYKSSWRAWEPFFAIKVSVFKASSGFLAVGWSLLQWPEFLPVYPNAFKHKEVCSGAADGSVRRPLLLVCGMQYHLTHLCAGLLLRSFPAIPTLHCIISQSCSLSTATFNKYLKPPNPHERCQSLNILLTSSFDAGAHAS